MFKWDERKRVANIAKHGLDFERAKLIFDAPTFEGPDDRHNYGEQRIGAYGATAGEVFFVVYTWRGNRRRLISARKAASHEREKYYAEMAAARDEG
jgi:hypothetical protein